MPTLYIVATPIGNLEDISLRALRILGEVDFILCEDTRVAKKLLSHYKITTPTISYHQHSKLPKVERILGLLDRGKDLALVSDAGTPGISDPGGKLVQAVIERFGDIIKIESVPGPSAVTAALSISGIPTDKFIFMGFPPHKKGRQKFLKKLVESEWPIVVYESKHRIVKFLEELDKIADSRKQITDYDKEKKKKIILQSVVVCRELSKMHETVYRGEIKSIVERIKESKDAQKGEFVVIVSPHPQPLSRRNGRGEL
ncbi:16S rRNA (cytidine(1402)-2'-O)-methyltransferase [Candidatus Parcubacteria bacterium]|nr:16S rRNA (cytidine(1402)-2'-O)-methyltransferase [Candidatus Parcubacteria bacterium]